VRLAVEQGEVLGSPSVGRWIPAVGLGAPIQPGIVLGHLRRAGARLVVAAPRNAGGVVTSLASPGTWMEYGSELLTLGAGGDWSVAEAKGPSTASAEVPDNVTEIFADTDGTVYLHPEPGAPPFAAQGSEVAQRDTLALVEVMKTFNPVRSPIDGVVERICINDGDSIEAGAPLFWIATK
jgi:acetyl/propionyl-CoA carboxylase alpha subunit